MATVQIFLQDNRYMYVENILSVHNFCVLHCVQKYFNTGNFLNYDIVDVCDSILCCHLSQPKKISSVPNCGFTTFQVALSWYTSELIQLPPLHQLFAMCFTSSAVCNVLQTFLIIKAKQCNHCLATKGLSAMKLIGFKCVNWTGWNNTW